LFDQDQNVDNDIPAVRKLRLEVVMLPWAFLTTALVILFDQSLARLIVAPSGSPRADLAIHRQGARELSSLLVAVHSTAQ
jgi:hypothetical protein